MGIEKWSKKWMDEHKDASIQEFAVALSRRMMFVSVFAMCIQVIGFISVIVVLALLKM